ncbi:hypothetical protein BD311DRAFT_748825 [Dichomitus squalens]|uniref:Uncharacterized protein n=1 Tax=Dichomitus squalens TaxID=114155 RepID=A0A4Q9N159_9APHY|nr:hypothetical protein BD311DRAFT_748825 [Dichomitus squalens]
MARAPRIETASRRAKDLPRDPTYWVDQDLLSFVSLHYPPIEASPLSSVIEKHKLTPQALWYLQDSHEHLSTIAEDESLKETLLELAESVQPAVSPTTPRVRHVRRLSEDLLRPPPPSPPPAVPSPPPPEEPVLEEDDDVAESIVSEWAFDEDRDVDDNSAPAAGESSAPADTAPVPGSPVQGLGLHTGEERSDVPETAQPPQPESTGGVDLMTFEDDSQQEMTPLQATSQPPAAAPVNADADHAPAADPPLEEMISAQGASAGTHVPSATEEEPSSTTATRSADQLAPSDEPLATPRASQDAPAGEPADPGPSTQTSPVEDEDHRRFSERDSTPAADPPRTASPSSDYHDANSTHDEEGEQQQAPAAPAAPEESSSEPAQQAEGHGPSAVDQQSATETEAPVSAEDTSEDKHDEVSVTVTPNKGAPDLSGDVSGLSEGTSKPDEDVSKLDEGASKDGGNEPQVTDTIPAVESAQQPSLASSSVEPASHARSEETVPEGGAQSSALQEDEVAQQVGSGDAEKVQQSQLPLPEPTLPDRLSSERSSETVAPPEQSDKTVKAQAPVIDDVLAETSVENVGEDKNAKVEATETNATETETPPPAATLEQTDKPAVVADDTQLGSTEQGVDGTSSGTSHEAVTAEAKPAQGPDQTDDASQVPGNSTGSTSTPSEPPATETPAPTTSANRVGATMPATPLSPTVKLATGREMQLISLNSESREQTPAASASGTPAGASPSLSGSPSGASPSPSTSRQGSPPAEGEGEGASTSSLRDPIPSSSSSASAPTEGPTPLTIKTAFGPSSERVRSAGPAASAGVNAWAARGQSGWGSASSPAVGSPAWNSVHPQSPAAQIRNQAWGSALPQSSVAQVKSSVWGKGSLFSSLSSTVSSLVHGSQPQSEPTTRSHSQERETHAPRPPLTPTPVSARQGSVVGREGPWAQKRTWASSASSSTSSRPPMQQNPPENTALPLLSPSAPALQQSSSTTTNADNHYLKQTSGSPSAGGETSHPAPVQDTTSRSAGGSAESRRIGPDMQQELPEDLDESVLVDPKSPSAENGEASGIKDTHITSENTNGGGEDTQGASSGIDDELVVVSRDDVPDVDKDAGSGSTPKEADDDENGDAPPDKRQEEHTRQVTGNSESSAFTSETETHNEGDGDDESSTGRQNPPHIQVTVTGLAADPQDVPSPNVDSPVVGANSSRSRNARKKANRKAKQQTGKSGADS